MFPHKISYASIMIGPDIIVFSPNEVRSHFQICDNPMITFGKRGLCLGFSKNSHVDSLDRFKISVVEKVKLDIYHLTKQKHSKEEKMKLNLKIN